MADNEANISCSLFLSGVANRELTIYLVTRRSLPGPATSFSEGMMSRAMAEIAKKLARKGIVNNMDTIGRYISVDRNHSWTSLSCSRQPQVRLNAMSEIKSIVKKEAFSARSMGLRLVPIAK